MNLSMHTCAELILIFLYTKSLDHTAMLKQVAESFLKV